MNITIIAAIDEEGGIGKQNSMPWYYPRDLQWFKYNTYGSTCIVGNTTHSNIGALPGRTWWVASRDDHPDEIENRVEFNTLKTYVRRLRNGSPGFYGEVYVCGGASIYKQMLPYADKLILTRVPGNHECDTFFPEFKNQFKFESSFELADDLKVQRWIIKNYQSANMHE